MTITMESMRAGYAGRRVSAMRRRANRSGNVELFGAARINRAAAELELADAVWKTCPWQPRELVATGLRQWLRCAGVALQDGQIIGMPSRAVDEAWHGFILCTARYARFCQDAYGQFLHHHPGGGAPAEIDAGDGAARLGRTVAAWTLVAESGEDCVLWDLDLRLGVEDPWTVSAARVATVTANLAGLARPVPERRR